MIWQQPWAWLGALSIAVPIVIHLLGRRRPRPIQFPTLRFIGVSKVAPARRHRLNDIPLLIVRIAILLAATAALAQPWLRTLPRPTTANGGSRAIVVDTSASMSRAGDGGRSLIETARDGARAMAASDPRARIIESASLAEGVTGAAHWLAAQPAPREITIVTDLQRGSFSDADAAAVPADIGLRFERMNAVQGADVTGGRVVWPTGVFTARVTPSRDRTTAAWAPDDQSGNIPAPRIHAASADREAIDVAIAAARTEGLRVSVRLGYIDLYLPGSPERLDGTAAASLNEPWMANVIADVRRDPTLQSLARAANRAPSPIATSRGATPVLLDAAGQPLLLAQAGSNDAAGSRLQLVVNVAADDVFLPALLTSVARAASDDVISWSELEPETANPADIARWTRQPAPSAAPTESSRTDSDGRWFWALALILIGLDTWMRRAPAAGRAEVERARVA